MSYIEFGGHFIADNEIIGIGPLYRRDKITDIPNRMFYFDLYCKGNTIRVESEIVSEFDLQMKSDNAKRLSVFAEMYNNLLIQVKGILL